MTFTQRAEVRRTEVLNTLDADAQAALGQYFTPVAAAEIIADLPTIPTGDIVRILDPGAGSGMLGAAMVERLRASRPDVAIELTAVELDEAPLEALDATLADLRENGGVKVQRVSADFIEWALDTDQRFDIVIQNPPYRKLRTDSPAQATLRRAGIDVPNIYAAFLALGIRLLADGGQQVAITPRSWMNGTYYSDFRRQFVNTVGIESVHTFESRSKVFKDTNVLQEAIVVSATRGASPDVVQLRTSHDHNSGITSRSVPYPQVVTDDFIHVPASEKDAEAVAWMSAHVTHTLADLGLTVSTGRVVDFRSRDMLHHERLDGAAPMVNSTHLRGGVSEHPLAVAKKPQWFKTDPKVEARLLVPSGCYVLIKRFSAKEEKRRVVAAVWESTEPVAFDNKLNYVHASGAGLDPEVARGLTVFLNSTRLDDYFRVFSGHTQVNATDLRQMKFPTAEQLRLLALTNTATQADIDAAVESAVATANAVVAA
ncbi:Eco57I restriction-modification methylase domain-containing protein [Microbacterium maritypicum]